MKLFKINSIIIKILAVVVPLGIITMFIIYMSSFTKKELEEKEWFKNMYLLLVFSVATIFVIIPIADSAHFVIGAMIAIISAIYLIYMLLVYILSKKEKIKKFIGMYSEIISKVLLIAAICNSLYLFIMYIRRWRKI